MRLHQASLSLSVLRRYHDLFPDEPPNVLLSLAYNESERKQLIIDYRFMLAGLVADSGAWSVAQGSSVLSFEEVVSFYQEHGHRFDRYFTFDTDFSDKGFANNIANQIEMERRGLTPVPAVHNFYDEEIDYYLSTGKYDWLALGSSQSKTFKAIKYAVDRIKTWGNPNIRIHWFGGSRFDWLCRLPIASCDTTSWAAIGANGMIMFWNPFKPGLNKSDRIYAGGKMRKLQKSEHHINIYPWRSEFKDYLAESFHLTFEDLRGYDGVVNTQLVNMRYYVELERRINEERIRRGIPLE